MKYDGKSSLTREGALITVRFVAYEDKRGVEPGIPLKMLIDTGADSSIVSEDVPRRLGIDPLRFDSVSGVTGDVPERWPVFPLCMLLNVEGGRVFSFRQDFLAAPQRATSLAHQGLVGLDFLAFCRFVFDGPSQQFELEFPQV